MSSYSHMMNKCSLFMRLWFLQYWFCEIISVVLVALLPAPCWLLMMENCCVAQDKTGSWTNLDQSHQSPPLFSLVRFPCGITLLQLFTMLTWMLGHWPWQLVQNHGELRSWRHVWASLCSTCFCNISVTFLLSIWKDKACSEALRSIFWDKSASKLGTAMCVLISWFCLSKSPTF